jgi:hypothetical protein
MTCIGAGLSAVALFPEDAQLRRDVQQGEST